MNAVLSVFCQSAATWFDRLQQCALIGPAKLYAVFYRIFRQAKVPVPLTQCACFSVESNTVAIPSVIGLLYRSGPLAIFGRIVAHVVDSINRSRGTWTWPHVCEKVNKTSSPSVAHFDATGTVAVIAWDVRVIATVTHVLKYSVFGRLGHTVSSPRPGSIDALASTAFSASRIHAERLLDFLGSAYASAQDISLAGRRANDSQSVKCSSYVGFSCSGHNRSILA